MGVDHRNHLFAPRLSTGWALCRSLTMLVLSCQRLADSRTVFADSRGSVLACCLARACQHHEIPSSRGRVVQGQLAHKKQPPPLGPP